MLGLWNRNRLDKTLFAVGSDVEDLRENADLRIDEYDRGFGEVKGRQNLSRNAESATRCAKSLGDSDAIIPAIGETRTDNPLLYLQPFTMQNFSHT